MYMRVFVLLFLLILMLVAGYVVHTIMTAPSNAEKIALSHTEQLKIVDQEVIARLKSWHQNNTSIKTDDDESIKTWRTKTAISPIDDSKTVYIWTGAVSPSFTKYESTQPRLYLRCKENKTDVFIEYDIFIGTDTKEMTIRFDKNKAIKQRWIISTDNEAVFSRKAIQFIKSFFGKKTLFVEITPYGESPIQSVFNIQNVENVITPLRESCHW